MEQDEINKLKQAGKIAKQAVDYARSIIKPGMPLLEIAEKIDAKIAELGGKPAFPVNLSIDTYAAHCTPAWNDTEKAHGLLKVDIGVQIEGYVADTAFSLDLENNSENKKLIEAAEAAVKAALETIKKDEFICNIGDSIEKAIKSRGFNPIQNLSGHSIEQNNLHSGIMIPNFNNTQKIKIEEGVYAIEPFSTNGLGSVKDSKSSGIYALIKTQNVRDPFAREVLDYIIDEYKTLPFCSRWIYKKFGSRGLLALKRIEEAGLLHHYPQLAEKGAGKVAQAEHTVIITDKEKIVTTI